MSDRPGSTRRRGATIGIGIVAAALVSCAAAPDPARPGGGRPDVTAPEAAVVSCVDQIAGTLDTRARAGQLLMVGAPLGVPVGPSARTVERTAAGGVILAGRGRAGTADIATRSALLQDTVAGGRIGLLVAADQEGGRVQALSGTGFSTIPPAAVQGGWGPDELQVAALRWGQELHAAGVNLDLAPVADVLDPALGARNRAVGSTRRAFGTAPEAVESSVAAFTEGLRSAGVGVAVKHFPGLGRVVGNTDFTASVRDTTTTGDSPWLRPFQGAIERGTPVMMISSAIYTGIDRTQPALFSAAVIDELLRGRLGFTGVVVSDDLGAAAAVTGVAPSARATRFVDAGGDIILTVDPTQAQPMLDGLVARMTEDPAFAARVRASVDRVLSLKATLGLLRC